jgi:hypothetical protein
MGGNPGLDNGNAFMRARRTAPPTAVEQAAFAQIAAAQQEYLRRYNAQNPYLMPRAWTNAQAGAPTPGERPAPEDTTGLKMLDEFLQRRKRDGNQR